MHPKVKKQKVKTTQNVVKEEERTKKRSCVEHWHKNSRRTRSSCARELIVASFWRFRHESHDYKIFHRDMCVNYHTETPYTTPHQPSSKPRPRPFHAKHSRFFFIHKITVPLPSTFFNHFFGNYICKVAWFWIRFLFQIQWKIFTKTRKN